MDDVCMRASSLSLLSVDMVVHVHFSLDTRSWVRIGRDSDDCCYWMRPLGRDQTQPPDPSQIFSPYLELTDSQRNQQTENLLKLGESHMSLCNKKNFAAEKWERGKKIREYGRMKDERPFALSMWIPSQVVVNAQVIGRGWTSDIWEAV